MKCCKKIKDALIYSIHSICDSTLMLFFTAFSFLLYIIYIDKATHLEFHRMIKHLFRKVGIFSNDKLSRF